MADPAFSPPEWRLQEPSPRATRGADDPAPLGQGPSGGLRVLRLVRETSEAQFYQAQYPDGMEVALLVLPPAATAGQAAQRLRLTHAARIRHPSVAAVYEVGSTDDGSFFAVLEQFAGERLSDGVSAGRVYGLKEAIDVTLQIAAGLEAAYREGFVHGSLSPSTIVAVPAAGTATRVKLTGFTLRSEVAANEATTPVLSEAIAPYASPERRSGQTPDEPSEVYSLGAVFHYLLTGVPPGPGRPDDAVPRPARAVLERALATPPDRRFRTISELAHALRGLQAPAVSDRRSPRRARALIAAGVAVALIGGSWLLSRSGGGEAVSSTPQPAWDTARAEPHASSPVARPARARRDTVQPPARRSSSTRRDADADRGDETGMVATVPPEETLPPPARSAGPARPPKPTGAAEQVERKQTPVAPAAAESVRPPGDEPRSEATPVRTLEEASRRGSGDAPPAVPPPARRVLREPAPSSGTRPRSGPAPLPTPRLPEENAPAKTAAMPRTRGELEQDQGLRQAIGDIIRLGIAEDVAEVQAGTLRVRLTAAAMEVPSFTYNLQRLYLAYSASTDHLAGATVELWQGRERYGRFTREGLLPPSE